VSNVPTAQKFVVVEKKGAVATLTLSRPEKLNALNAALLTELDAAVDALRADASVRAIVVTGAGEKAFVAGADIGELSVLDTRGAEAASAFGSRVFRKLETGPQAVIAAVNGFALGGGCELALACDFIYASDRAKFGQPEVNLGVIPGFGGTQRLPRRIGPGRAMELILTGDIIGADEAFRLGLVNRVVPAAELMAEVRKVADKIAAKGPLAIAAARKAVRRSSELSLSAGNDLEAELFALLFATQDQKEGMKAFLAKRPANFEGK